MLIGICGKSGSGKTTLANKLTSLYPQSYHLNIDNIGHDVINIESVKNELVKTFSDNIKLSEAKTKLENEINDLKRDKMLNSQYLEEAKKATEENYILKGKNLSLSLVNDKFFPFRI